MPLRAAATPRDRRCAAGPARAPSRPTAPACARDGQPVKPVAPVTSTVIARAAPAWTQPLAGAQPSRRGRIPRGCSATAPVRAGGLRQPRAAQRRIVEQALDGAAQRPPAAAARAATSRGVSTCVWVRRLVATIGRARAQVGVDLQRRVGAGDARRHEHVGGRDDRRRCRAPVDGPVKTTRPPLAVRASRAAPRPARDAPPTTSTVASGCRREHDRHRIDAAGPGPGTARTCPCRARAAPRPGCPSAAAPRPASSCGASSTSPPITFSMSIARSPAPIVVDVS